MNYQLISGSTVPQLLVAAALAAFALMALADRDSAARAVTPDLSKRALTFEQGRDTVTVEGKLAPNSAEMWVVSLRKLQRLDVQVKTTGGSGGKIKLGVAGADGTVLLADDPPVAEFRGEAPVTQDYSISVIAYDDTAPRYALTVAVLPAVVRVRAEDNGTLVDMPLGTALEVALDCNPSTGYSWEVLQMDEAVLKQGETATRGESDLVGAPGRCIIRFHSIGMGTSVLKLGYRRPWEKDAKPVKVFEIAVNVKAAP
ncbi:MAG: protease inhibitor I42 family protein [Acidobacteriota bacterium]